MKIYVTGLGIVSGIGIGVSENIEALQQGKHGIGKVTLFPTALDVTVSEQHCWEWWQLKKRWKMQD